ncbi:MAG: preprotein translocase subunit SecY [Alphaproteobacteria bacterium]
MVFSNINFLNKASELKSRILFTLFALVIYRVGSYIPLPFINSEILSHLASENSSGILGMFNMLSGGSLARMSIFALAIMPYITSSIIMQLFSVIFKSFETLKKDGEAGRRKINQYTKYLTILLAAIQALGIAIGLEKVSSQSGFLVETPGAVFRLITLVTLTTGTVFLMWLGEQITSRGIGNGTSLIIFAGIVAGLPNAMAKMFELGRIGAISTMTVLVVIIVTALILALIVFVERAQRKIIVQYPKRQIGNKVYGGENSHIPLKLNTAGVIPPIFASAILLFPLTIAKLPNSNNTPLLNTIISYLDHGKPLYIMLYIVLIIFFSFFYTAIIFNPNDTADNLKKHNGFIPGRKPGKNTAEYLDYILTRITVIGALYITFICAFPEVIMANYSIPFYLSGTSILIVVNVVIDTITQVQTYLFTHQYENLIKKAKLRERLK